MTSLTRSTLLTALLVLPACARPDGEDLGQSVAAELCVGGSNVEGVDVSYSQPVPINWNAVKTVAGSFAIAKAAEGTAIDDTAFPSNWPAMRAAGLTRGAYHFFKGSVDGAAQANHFLAVVAANGGFQSGDLPPAVDIEYSPTASLSSLTGNTASDIARLHATLDALQSATGRLPIIYTNNNTWGILGNPSGFQAYPVWLANWGATCTASPPGLPNLKVWQYSSTGSVPGISGSVDRDRFNGTAADLLAFAGGAPSGGTCDNNVAVGDTACSQTDSTAEFVCTSPGLPSSQQWTRRACPAGQACVGTHCQPQGGGSCSCGGGATFWGTPVAASDTSCGFQVCGSDNQRYTCQSDGWHGAGNSPCNCRCANGADAQGRAINPDYTYCGYQVCGGDHQHYSCTATGWSAQHDTCN